MKPPFPGAAVVEVTRQQLSTTLGDEVVILGLNDSVYYGLSQVGVRVWELAQTRCTLDDITAILASEYDVSRDQAAADLQDLLDDLQSRGLVAIVPPTTA